MESRQKSDNQFSRVAKTEDWTPGERETISKQAISKAEMQVSGNADPRKGKEEVRHKAGNSLLNWKPV